MRYLVLIAVAACGRIGFDPLGGDDDGARQDGGMSGGDGAATNDAAMTTGDGSSTDGITGTGTWSPPMPLPGVGAGGNDSEPWLSEDGLTLYFESTRGGGLGQGDLYLATRANRSGSFDVVNVGAPVSSTFDEHSPFLADNGQTLYFTSNRFGGYDIFTSDWNGVGWSIPQRDTQLSSVADDDVDIALSFDGRTAIVTRIHNGVRRFYRSTRFAANGTWSTPLQVSELATAQQAGGPALAGDGTLYFHAQLGALALFTARFNGSGFDQPETILELDSGLADTQPHVNAFADHLVFVQLGRIVESVR